MNLSVIFSYSHEQYSDISDVIHGPDPLSLAPQERYSVNVKSVTWSKNHNSASINRPRNVHQCLHKYLDIECVQIFVKKMITQTVKLVTIRKLLPLCRDIFVRNIHEIGVT